MEICHDRLPWGPAGGQYVVYIMGITQALVYFMVQLAYIHLVASEEVFPFM